MTIEILIIKFNQLLTISFFLYNDRGSTIIAQW